MFIVHCCINECCFSTKKWSTYRSHINRKHKDILYQNGNNEVAPVDDEADDDNDINDDVSCEVNVTNDTSNESSV